MKHRISLLMMVAAALAMAGCDNGRQADLQAQQAAAVQARAARDLDMYRQLLASESFELAAPIGEELVAAYPDTDAAREVLLTLDDTRQRGAQTIRARRLERLWSYQTGTESGAAQHTASIYSSQPQAVDKRVRLILRRHADWGQSVYFFGSGDGFACPSPCRVSVTFDQRVHQVPAHLPKTGEPALLIDDPAQFIAWLEQAQVLRAQLPGRDGSMQSVEFEVGGFDPERYHGVALDGD